MARIRRIYEEYWAAFNDYDADAALEMLDDDYRVLEEELIREDIGRMKLFRVNLEISEESPPSINAEGDYETWLSMDTPLDTRTIKMVFRRIDGEWQIIFSDEVGEN